MTYLLIEATDGTYRLRRDGSTTVTEWADEPTDGEVWDAIMDDLGVNGEAVRETMKAIARGYDRGEEPQ